MNCPKCGSTLYDGLCPVCSLKGEARRIAYQARWEAGRKAQAERKERQLAALKAEALSSAGIAELVSQAYQKGYQQCLEDRKKEKHSTGE